MPERLQTVDDAYLNELSPEALRYLPAHLAPGCEGPRPFSTKARYRLWAMERRLASGPSTQSVVRKAGTSASLTVALAAPGGALKRRDPLGSNGVEDPKFQPVKRSRSTGVA